MGQIKNIQTKREVLISRSSQNPEIAKIGLTPPPPPPPHLHGNYRFLRRLLYKPFPNLAWRYFDKVVQKETLRVCV